MKLFAIFTCVVFLYGVSSEIPETLDFDFEEAALQVWGKGQTNEDWDEGHTLAWMYGTSEQVSYALDFDSLAETEGLCSCSGTQCRCCLEFKIFFKKFSACLIAGYEGGKLCASAKLNSWTLVEHCIAVSKKEVLLCKTVLTRKVCVGLTDITWGSRSVTAHGKISVAGILDKKIGTFTLKF